jgi:hypothetical protein
MIIGHKRDVHLMESLPNEVSEGILNLVSMLDNRYGDKRNLDVDDGGYALILESKEDLPSLKEIEIDIYDEVFEYVKRVPCDDSEDWVNALVLFNNEFGVSIYMPVSLASKKMVKEME